MRLLILALLFCGSVLAQPYVPPAVIFSGTTNGSLKGNLLANGAVFTNQVGFGQAPESTIFVEIQKDLSAYSGIGFKIYNLDTASPRSYMQFENDMTRVQKWGLGMDVSGSANKAFDLRDNTSSGSPTRLRLTPSPASVATATGGNAVGSLILAPVGGETTIATTGAGGVGGPVTIDSGAGGVANSATTTSTGGAGGAMTIKAGAGGSPAVAGTTAVGGAGGALVLKGGAGGAPTLAGTLNGGIGQYAELRGGDGGAGASAGAVGGNVYIAPGASTGAAAAGSVVIGVNQAGTAIGTTKIGSGGAAIASILSATATLDFGNILAAASADLTITVTGAAVGDSVSIGLPAAPDVSITFMGFVSAVNTVTIRAFNVGAIAVDPASGTYRSSVMHF